MLLHERILCSFIATVAIATRQLCLTLNFSPFLVPSYIITIAIAFSEKSALLELNCMSGGHGLIN